MQDIGSVKINVIVNDGAAQAALSGLKQSTANTATSMVDSLNKAGSAMTGLGGRLSIGVTAPVMLAGKSFFALSNNIDSAKVALTRMLGGMDKAKDILSEVQKFSASTPFEFPGLVQTTKQLIGFKIPANEVVEVLKNLGNAAGGEQEKLERLALAYGKLNVKGKASMEELNMFLEAGVPILDELGKQFGVSTAQIYKMVETGRVGFKDVDKALKALTTGTGMFSGILEDQSATMGGMYSTMKDEINAAGVAILKSLEPAIRVIVKSVTEAASWFGSLSDNTKTVVASVIVLAAAVGPALLLMGQLSSGISAAITLYGSMGAAIKAVRAAMIALNTTMLKNPFTALALAVTTAAVALWKLNKEYKEYIKKQNEAFEAERDWSNGIEKLDKKTLEGREKTIMHLIALNEGYVKTLRNQGREEGVLDGMRQSVGNSISTIEKLKKNLDDVRKRLWQIKVENKKDDSPSYAPTLTGPKVEEDELDKMSAEEQAKLKSEAFVAEIGVVDQELHYMNELMDLSAQGWDLRLLSTTEAFQKLAFSIRDSMTTAAQSFVDFLDRIGGIQELTLKKTKEFVKELTVMMVSSLEKQVIAQQVAAIAQVWAKNIGSFGLFGVPKAAAETALIMGKTAGAVIALETLKTSIRAMATGGLLTGPQLVLAGEAGNEAYMPLSNPTAMRYIGQAVADAMPASASGGTQPVTVNFELDGEVFSKTVEVRLENRARNQGKVLYK